MALMILAAAAGGAAGGVTIANGTAVTGYAPVRDSSDFGNYQPEFILSSRRDGLTRAAHGSLQPRLVTIGLRIYGSSKDNLTQLISAIESEALACTRQGGTLKWQSNGASFPVYFTVRAARLQTVKTDRGYEALNRAVGTLELTCDPLAVGDSMGFVDGFDTDDVTGAGSVTNWTASSVANLSVSGGLLLCSSPTRTLWHTGRGYQYTDAQATIKFRTGGDVVTAWGVKLILRLADVNNYLDADVLPTQLRINKTVANVATQLATVTPAAWVANTTYWLRFRIEGALCTSELWTSEPTPAGTPAFSTTYVLTAAEAALFVQGYAGLRLKPNITGGGIDFQHDDFTVAPYTYKVKAPDVVRLVGVPGDAPALATVDIVQPAGVAAAAAFGLASWAERPRSNVSLTANGGFETDAVGWSVAAVTGVTGAATSIARDTTAARNKYGAANGLITCPATANTGATFAMYRKFRKGRTYAAVAWASSAAGVTLARIRLGVNTDIASSNPLALTTTPVFHGVNWQPTADYDVAYFCAEITAATLTAWNIDGVMVFEVDQAVLPGAQLVGDTSMVVTSLPATWPAAPFTALLLDPSVLGNNVVNEEVVYVTSTTAPGTVAMARAQDSSTAFAPTAGSIIVPLPLISRLSDGVSGQAHLEVLNAAAGQSLVGWAVTADANARSGSALAVTGTVSAFSALFPLDPGMITPLEFSEGQIIREVWARVSMVSTLVSPNLTLSVISEDGSTYSVTRYELENQSNGLQLVLPSSGTAYRLVRLGMIALDISTDTRRRRWMLKLAGSVGSAVSAGFSVDYLMLTNPAARLSSMTGVANDSNFAAFSGATTEVQRRVFHDLSSGIAKPPSAPFSAFGIVGTEIRIPQGSSDLLVDLSNLVPNDPSSIATAEQNGYAGVIVSVNPTPRYTTIR